jgi:hypothetical protein
MRISELKQTVNFVKKAVIDTNLQQFFQQLIQVLQQNARMQPGQQPQPITQQKASLIAAIKSIRPETLTLNERRLLKTFIDVDLMGNSGVEKVNTIFAEHNLDPIGAVNAFDEMRRKYEQLISSASDILRILAPIDVGVVETDIEDGHAVLQITFKAKAAMGNVTDWKEYSEQWWRIVRSFGLLTDTTADQAKILSFQQGSVIVEVSALYILVKAVGLAADKIMSVIERLLDLRKKIQEIKRLDLTNKQIELDLQKEADAFVENKMSQITENLILEINKAKAEDGEVKNGLQLSIKDLYQFLDKGGTVDCRLRLMDKEPEEATQLRDVYGKIRTLETRIEELKLITDAKEKDR